MSIADGVKYESFDRTHPNLTAGHAVFKGPLGNVKWPIGMEGTHVDFEPMEYRFDRLKSWALWKTF